VILNVEKWKVLTHNVKFRASQNLFICVGTVEDNGIWKVDRRIRHTVGDVTQIKECTVSSNPAQKGPTICMQKK
jgi:hypothetical protein